MLDIERLNQLLKEKGISKSFIASKLGKQRSLLINWEKGRASPTEEDIIEIAHLLNVSVDYLSGKTDIKKETAQNEQSLTPAQQELLDVVTGLSVDEIKAVRKYAEFVKSQHKE